MTQKWIYWEMLHISVNTNCQFVEVQCECVCVCVCVCLVLCSFITCLGLCNHHHCSITLGELPLAVPSRCTHLPTWVPVPKHWSILHLYSFVLLRMLNAVMQCVTFGNGLFPETMLFQNILFFLDCIPWTSFHSTCFPIYFHLFF